MLRSIVLASCLVVSSSACKKGGDKVAPVATATAGSVDKDGVRHVPIEAGSEGYKPETIKGKPGEKLLLVFTRTVEGDCLAKVKTPDGKEVDLPMNKPTGVAVTVPQTGKVEFACAMDMFKGVIVADPT